MIQCGDCEYFNRGGKNQLSFKCDPFATIKEPECLAKWQLLRTSELLQKMDRMVRAYEATLDIYRRIQPLQEKMFRHMEREVDDLDEGNGWKHEDDQSDSDDEDGGLADPGDSPWSDMDPR